MLPPRSCCAVAAAAATRVPSAVPLRGGCLLGSGRRHHGECLQPGQARNLTPCRAGPGCPREPAAPPELGAGAGGAHRRSREQSLCFACVLGRGGGNAGGRDGAVSAFAPEGRVRHSASRRHFPGSGRGLAAEARGLFVSGGPHRRGWLRASGGGCAGFASPLPHFPGCPACFGAVTGERRGKKVAWRRGGRWRKRSAFDWGGSGARLMPLFSTEYPAPSGARGQGTRLNQSCDS